MFDFESIQFKFQIYIFAPSAYNFRDGKMKGNFPKKCCQYKKK